MSRHHRYAGQAKGAAWDAARAAVMDRDRHRCTDCAKAGRLEVHHVRPISWGGTNDAENLKTLCRQCHLAAHGPRRTSATTAWADCVAELVKEVAETRRLDK